MMDKEQISIHAPAKGATSLLKTHCLKHSISIHAPAKGATIFSTPIRDRSHDFNPRSREGSDETGKEF